MGVYKLSAAGSLATSRTVYKSMLVGNTAFNPSSYYSIASYVAPTGNAGSLILDNIPQTYTHLQIRITARSTYSSANDLVYFWNAPVGITSSQWHNLYGDGANPYSGNGTAAVYAGPFPAATSTSNTFGSAIVDILDYSNTNKLKTWRSFFGYDTSGAGTVGIWSGMWLGSTNAISSIRVNFGNGGSFAAGSRLDVYGIKGA